MAALTASLVDEEAVVRRASRGDRAAFEELYNRYARIVYAILLARVPRTDAEDLVQDVFVSAFRKLRTCELPPPFEVGCPPLRATGRSSFIEQRGANGKSKANRA